jgi:hypothetical protein
MSRKSFREKWSEIPFERKVAMFVAPLFVAVASALLVRLLLGDSDDTEGRTDGQPATNLEVVDLVVAGGDPLRDLGEPVEPPLIDVTVRNAGDLISIVKGATFTVRNFGFIEPCEGGAGLEPSVQYDVELLPVDPPPGETFEVKVSQQIPPNGADRFTFRLDVPESHRQLGQYVYQLDMTLFHDTEERPLPVGTVLVSAPTLPHPYSLDPAGAVGPSRDCYERNIATFNRMIQLEGERSPMFSQDLLQVP